MNDETRETVREWLDKAASDWTTVEILTADERCPIETVCFHCQQYVEKLLKAFLTLHGTEAPRTHDLKRLIQLAAPRCPELSRLADRVDSLTGYAIQSRYPGDWESIDRAEMREIMLLAKEIGGLLLPKLQS